MHWLRDTLTALNLDSPVVAFEAAVLSPLAAAGSGGASPTATDGGAAPSVKKAKGPPVAGLGLEWEREHLELRQSQDRLERLDGDPVVAELALNLVVCSATRSPERPQNRLETKNSDTLWPRRIDASGVSVAPRCSITFLMPAKRSSPTAGSISPPPLRTTASRHRTAPSSSSVTAIFERRAAPISLDQPCRQRAISILHLGEEPDPHLVLVALPTPQGASDFAIVRVRRRPGRATAADFFNKTA